jgi:plastocyanin
MKKFIGSKSRIMISTVFLVAVLSIINGCSKSTDNNTPDTSPITKVTPGVNEIFIQDMLFSPATISVTAGTTIKWTNKDGVAHTVTSDTGSAEIFNSGSLTNGSTFTWKFNTAGTFNYHCSLHAGMNASVVVN